MTTYSHHILWDSSALGKRYVAERGSDTIDALFALNPFHVTAYLAYAEVANIIRRSRNLGLISRSEFNDFRQKLRAEMLQSPNASLLTVSDTTFLNSISLADKHNLNASDAALLEVFGLYSKLSNTPCVLVVSDVRLARAATAEGLACLNLELIAPHDLQQALQQITN